MPPIAPRTPLTEAPRRRRRFPVAGSMCLRRLRRLLRPSAGRIAFVTVMAVAIIAGASHGAPKEPTKGRTYRTHPGYVDPGRLVDLADEKGLLVEVTLHGKMLELLTRRADRRADGSLASILRDLLAMNAIIADVTDRREEARHHLRNLGRVVREKEWEQFVRVREPDGGDFTAFMRTKDGDHVDGLLVVGFTSESQMIFVNLVGRVDMEQISLLGERLGVPGLDDLPPRSEVEKKKERERKKTDARDGDSHDRDDRAMR